MRNVANMFYRNRTPGGRIQISTPLGDYVLDDSQQADRKAAEIFQSMTKRLGREPTHEECVSGPKCRDDRDWRAKELRQNFKVKTANMADPRLALADEIDPPGQQKHDYTMTRRQSLAATLRDMSARDADKAVKNARLAEHLRRVNPTLEKIDKLIDKERWSSGSQTLSDLLSMWRECLVEPDADPAQTAYYKRAATEFLARRATEEREAFARQREAIERASGNVTDESYFADPVPEPLPVSDDSLEHRYGFKSQEEQRLEGEQRRHAEVERRMAIEGNTKSREEIASEVIREEATE